MMHKKHWEFILTQGIISCNIKILFFFKESSCIIRKNISLTIRVTKRFIISFIRKRSFSNETN
jgi:hypothetical protein